MLPRNQPDGIHIAFDDHRLVNNAGLILPATLASHLGLPQLIRKYLDLGGAPGRANTGDKIMTLVASALALGVRTKGARPSRIFLVPRQPYHVGKPELADVQPVHPQGLGAVGPPGRAAVFQELEILPQLLQGRRRRAPRVRRQKLALRPAPRLEGPHRASKFFPGPGGPFLPGPNLREGGTAAGGSPALRDHRTSGDTVYWFKGDTPSR